MTMKKQRLGRMGSCIAALVLLGSACGGSSTSDAAGGSGDVEEAVTTAAPTTETPTTEAPTTEAPTTEAPTTEAPTTEAPAPDVDAGLDVDRELEAALILGLPAMGLEVDDDLIQCMADQGLTSDDILGDGEDGGNRLAVGVFACAPDEMAAVITPTLGVTTVSPEQAECVMAEAFRLIGGLGLDEGAAILAGGDDFPEQLREPIKSATTAACGLTDAEVDEILDS